MGIALKEGAELKLTFISSLLFLLFDQKGKKKSQLFVSALIKNMKFLFFKLASFKFYIFKLAFGLPISFFFFPYTSLIMAEHHGADHSSVF